MKTIYKLTLLTLVFSISFISSTNAQLFDDICATDNGDIQNLENVYTFSNDASILATMEPVVLNVYYWRIDAPDGSVHPWALTEQRALESIAYLNANFNQIGIFFKYRGMGHFSSPPDVVHKIKVQELDTCVTIQGPDPDGFETLSQCQRGALMSFVYSNDYVEPNAINFYIPRGLTDFGGSSQGPTKSITHPGGLISNTIIHELGHNFSLPHTWNGWYSPNNPDGCEHVTRDEDSDHFNALSRGDYLAGTAAMPDFFREYCVLNGLSSGDCVGPNAQYGFYYYDVDNCLYIGTTDYNRTDCAGKPYQIFPEDARNTMSYAPGSCRDFFSVDQGIKMKEHIANSNSLQQATNPDASSLYEPYQGEYYLAGPFNPQLHKPLFQPGFTYKFVECSGTYPQPADYGEYFSYNINNILLGFEIDEENFDDITHPNHAAVYIEELAQYNAINNDLSSPQKCYNNFNISPIGGTITLFNDGVFNTNVSITPQDSTTINSQNLINDLPQGLYKIEKNYQDGAIEETIIIKENN